MKISDSIAQKELAVWRYAVEYVAGKHTYTVYIIHHQQ